MQDSKRSHKRLYTTYKRATSIAKGMEVTQADDNDEDPLNVSPRELDASVAEVKKQTGFWDCCRRKRVNEVKEMEDVIKKLFEE